MSEASTPRVTGCEITEMIEENVNLGKHREVVGGMWEEIGTLQAEFLKSQGLLPQDALIDVGAGCFRAGVKLVPYLDPGNYYAIELQIALLEAGYTREIEPLGLASRFPWGNFAANATFDTSGFGRIFDFGIAQSVFTHLPIARLGICLNTLAPHFRPGGKFFVTVFFAPEEVADKLFKHTRGGVVTGPGRDPYHTTLTTLQDVATRATDRQMSVIGEWNHPRDQQMICFTRLA